MGFEPCVVPKLPYGIKKSYRECGCTNTCNLDALLALLYIATRSSKGMHRHGHELKSIPKNSLLARALDLMDQEKPDEARRLLYEALPDAKWDKWTSSQAPVTHNAHSNVGERAARLLCEEGTAHVVESVMQCDKCSHQFATEDQIKKQCNMTAFTHLDETSMVEDLFQQFLKKTCPHCNNAQACKRLEMKVAPKELLVVDLTKTKLMRKDQSTQQLFTMVPQRFVWRKNSFSLTGIIMGNGSHFVSVNRLTDSYVFYDGMGAGRRKGEGIHSQHGLRDAKPLAQRLQSANCVVRWALFEVFSMDDPLFSELDDATIDMVSNRVTAAENEWQPVFSVGVADHKKTPDCSYCCRKTREGKRWKAGEACLVVDDDRPVATKDFIHLDKECLLSFLDQAEPGPGCCTLMHSFCKKRPLLCNDLTGTTEPEKLLFQFWHTNRSLRNYPHRMDKDLGPVVF